MPKSRNNHYIPQWHQRGFFSDNSSQLHYLDLSPDKKQLPNGQIITMNCKSMRPPSRCFCKKDLYTTVFGEEINDEIERQLFGQIDDSGSRAVRAYINDDPLSMHENFESLFIYLDAQKIRTPKGLDWIQQNYPDLNQLQLMLEMQSIRTMHCTLWAEGVREIVSAKDSNVKFIISDHPITIYNYACPPNSNYCMHPNDPDISLKASQTIYPLDKDHALVLTNLEYAKDPDGSDPLEKRTNAAKVRQSLVMTDALIRTRDLTSDEVAKINYIIKNRAKKYIGGGKNEWLYPDKNMSCNWADLREVLLPPSDQTFRFGGEMFVGYEDGSTHYQDAFGRTEHQNENLIKNIDESSMKRNDPCGCGSGKKYKHCCKDIPPELRTTWKVLSIRQRNLSLYNAIYDILGLNNGKTWHDVRRSITDEQISDIYGFYGALWPLDTDIYELLPKPDGKLRGLYTGFIDPRTINAYALGMTNYFDELLIQHPFVNPNNMRPEFSPVKSPSKYKYQALKSILLLLYIEPLVISGLINLIPDICSFDFHLHSQMMDMAKERKKVAFISKRDKRISSLLNIEDLLNTTYMMPDNVRDNLFREEFPNLTDKEIANFKLALDAKAKNDPLVLLQDFKPGGGGQLIMFQMTPNYELALFLAQATGSVILTDSETRWIELQEAQYREQGIVSYPWQMVSDTINNIALDTEVNEITDHYSKAEFFELRNVLRSINNSVRNGTNNSDQIHRLTQRLSKAFADANGIRESEQTKPAKIQVLMPKGGFVDNNSQRLLLKSGCQIYMSKVDMVMYIN